MIEVLNIDVGKIVSQVVFEETLEENLPTLMKILYTQIPEAIKIPSRINHTHTHKHTWYIKVLKTKDKENNLQKAR